MFFRLKISLRWGATEICSWTSFILSIHYGIAKHLFSLTRLFVDDSSHFYSPAHIVDIAGKILLTMTYSCCQTGIDSG